MCQQDYEHIRNFTMESDFGDIFNIENASLVTDAGVLAMKNIAKRFQQVFPDILTKTYTPARFHFRHAGTPRTNTSIRAFARGLFGEASENVIYEPVPEEDWFLRPFEFCPAYSEETVDWARQRNAFREEGPEIQEMIQQINRKLGFHSSNQMNFTQIFIMLNWCRFKIAATFETSDSETGPHSPWCAPFSVAHHLVLEYYEDLEFYYTAGYGVRNQRLLENLNCGVIQDLLRHMQSENGSDSRARIFMTYADQIHSMLVALGTFTDVWPMHQHNFAQQTRRHWLSSLISPFSANLAVVRFE